MGDSGEQNMKIIPQSQVAAISLLDTDVTWSTANKPKVCACAAASSLTMATAMRTWASEKLYPTSANVFTAAAAAFGLWSGIKVGCWAFRDTQRMDGSHIKVFTAAGSTSFSCDDAKAREFAR